jgi:CRP-like cAMP-binding protein
MISSGRISYIFGSNNLEIKTFSAGSYFGDVELFKYIPRKFTAISSCFSEVLTVSNKVFLEILEKFPKILKEFQRKVEVQDHYDNENLNEILDLLEITEVSKIHTLEELQGQSRIFNKKPRNRPKLSTVFFRKTLSANRNLNENNSKIHLLMELQEIRAEIDNLAEIINKVSASPY